MRRLAVLVFLVAAPLAALEVPYLSGRVVDNADLVPDDVQQRIEQRLAAYEQQTGNQIAVLTIESLGDEALEDYTLRVAETWKLGQKGKDNGALFLISEQDRKMRIEVGYGLEPQLTDFETGRVLDNVVTPYFRSGDFGAGVEKGVDGIIASIGGEEVTPAPGADAPSEMPVGSRVLVGLIFVFVIGTFSLMAIFTPGCQSWFMYLFLMPFYAMFSSMVFPGFGVGVLIAWAVLFPILKLLFGKKLGSGIPTWGRRGGLGGPFIFGGGWGGGGGGGGFSGGGGSFGGGGSSGSW
ncbi:MAG TPA: TPM domain-containing protein [Thermoanaerobaculia bacterium]